MEQLEQGTAPDTGGWFIIAADRVKVVPVHPGMTLGETESGMLSYDRAHAQLELDIESDSSLVVRALGNIRLASSEGNEEQTDWLRCSRSVEISLSQRTLLLDTKFVRFTPSRRPLRLRVVYPPHDEIVTEIVAEAPAELIEPAKLSVTGSEGVMLPSSGSPVTTRFDLPGFHRSGRQTELRSSLRGMLDRFRYMATDLSARSNKTQKVLAACAVAIVALVLGVLAFYSSTSTKTPDDTDVVLQIGDPEVGESSAAGPGQLSDERPEPRLPSVGTVSTPVEKLDQTSDAAPDAGDIFRSTDENQLTGTAKPGALEQALGDQVVATSKETPPQETPPQEVAAREVASKEVSSQELVSNETNHLARSPSASVKPISAPVARERSAQAEQAERARAQQLAAERDLLAADVALEEGRLMMPEESSALALYSRVLSNDPDSPDALKGIASVKEQLVNRAFAQLAAGEWSLVPVTLDAAEKAGASVDLVADLRREASYQLRLAQAQAGQFDDLYPSQQLKAVAKERPRLSRWRSGGYRQVEVEFTVTLRGGVRDVQILGNPPPRLAETIERAVETWRFEPVLESGRPVPVRTRVIIEVGS